MKTTKSILLASAAALTLAAAPVAAQQGNLSWSLQAPFTVTGDLIGTDPLSGAPLRVGGSSSSIGGLQHTWVWLGGSWHRRTNASTPVLDPGADSATDTWRNQLVLLGTSAATGVTTWTYDGAQWRTQPTPALLTARRGHAMTFDSTRGRVVLFGGLTSTTNQMLADTWEWDGAHWQLRNPGAAPPARSDHRLAYDPGRNRVVLFGGRTNTSASGINDTWEWDGNHWLLRLTPLAPPARYQHGMVFDPQRQRIVMAGGIVFPGSTLRDAWEWDGSAWQPTIANSGPIVGIVDPTRLVYDASAGQTTMVDTSRAEVHIYGGGAWTTTRTAPRPRAAGAFAFDPGRGETILFGGSNSTQPIYGDTWRWQGDRWHEVPAAVAPAARQSAGFTADPARNGLVLFGGWVATSSSSGQPFADTWTWNGSQWTLQAPATSPPARRGGALAYHAPSQRVVLFGGFDGATNLGDTWLWDGTAWTQATPTHSPSPRSDAGVASRPLDVLLFGGAQRNGSQWSALGETWSWNGSDWTMVASNNAPSDRHGAAMTYDNDLDRVVLFGGYPYPTQVVADETWVFDGSDWSVVADANAPLVRTQAMLTYDSSGKRAILFGGSRSGTQNDLWVLATSAQNATFGNGCAGSLGTPMLTAASGDTPTVGGTAIAELTNLPESFALVAMGFSDAAFGTTPLPLQLGGYGMPGCELLAAADAVSLAIGSQNRAAWQLRIPFVSALAGLQFYLQAFALDPAANAAGATTSNGLAYRVGG